jgi:hypothetical protein
MITHNDYRGFGRMFLDEILGWIEGNLMPEEVFSENNLIDWALNNGFVREDDDE